MLEFELLSDDGDKLTYRYLCEGSAEDSGEVDFARSKGDVTAVRKAEADKRGSYWGHLARRLREFLDSGEFKPSGIVAWY